MVCSKMYRIAITLFSMVSLSFSQIIVDGNAYLDNQSDHGLVRVLFERTVPSAFVDSTFTDSDGYFAKNLEIGVYNITYSKGGYLTNYFNDFSLFSNTTLADVTLYEHVTLINVPSDYPTIQEAVNISIPGDTILVAPGTHLGGIHFNGKNIVVGSLFLSTNDTSYISQTIIANEGFGGSVITFGGGEDSSAKLIGLTITNGSANYGGGINCINSSPMLINLKIINNSASWGGGGLYFNNSNATVLNSTIAGNSVNRDGAQGGGILCEYDSNIIFENLKIINNLSSGLRAHGGGMTIAGSNAILRNSIIKNNTVLTTYNTSSNYSGGGGLYLEVSGMTIENVSILDNHADGPRGMGGGIFISSASPNMKNVLLSNNTAVVSGGGIYTMWESSPNLENVTISANSIEGNWNGIGAGIFFSADGYPTLSNVVVANNTGDFGVYAHQTTNIIYSNLWNNEGGNILFSGSEGWIGENVMLNANGDSCDLYNNIQADPQFVNPSIGDYHLQSTSPCVDAGSPDSPLDLDGTVSDQGTFFYDQSFAPSIIWVADTIIAEDLSYNYQLFAEGIPSPVINLVVYPEGMTINNSGVLAWIPHNNDVGDTLVSFLAINDLGSDTQTFNIHVTNVNDPPAIITTTMNNGMEDQPYNFTIQAIDDDIIHGDSIIYSLTTSPIGMTINSSSGEILWFPDINDVGDTVVAVTVTDNSNATDSRTFSLIVGNINDPPEFEIFLPDTSFEEDGNLSIPFWAVDSDGDSLSYEVYSDTNDVYVEYTDSLISISPADNWNGTVLVMIFVSDNETTISDSFNINVVAINDLPAIFALVSPENETLVDNSDSTSQTFVWEQAIDIDGDVVTYGLFFSNNDWDTSIYSIDTTSYRYNIEQFPRSTDIHWSVMAFDSDTFTAALDTNIIQIHAAVGIGEILNIPDEYALEQNYPNPFNPTTTIKYEIPEVSDVSMVIYDIRGRQIRSWQIGDQPAGWYQLSWYGNNEVGTQVATGMYFARLQAGPYSKGIKMVYLR